MNRRMRVLALAPYCDGTDVGEAWCAYQWVSHLAGRADVTLLTLRRDGWPSPSEQLPEVEVVEWDEVRPGRRLERLNSMLKPGYIHYWFSIVRWIRRAQRAGRTFDVAQQFTPIALRYPSPLAMFSIPYAVGPLGGSLETPEGFESECRGSSWFTRLRSVDRWRLRHDPLLRRSYSRAATVLGVAPYVAELLDPAVRRFEVISELGIDTLAPERIKAPSEQPLQLLHVGRGVRTKGLRDAVRAIARLPAGIDVHLHSAGQGEEITLCKHEAHRLGVTESVTFHGQIPRADVEALYQQADIFLFPSFREPSGSVIFEAMRNGLPVITTNVGGPGFVIDEHCGIRVNAFDPDQLAGDLATAIQALADDPHQREALGRGARRRVAEIGLWENKINWLQKLYEEIAFDDQTDMHFPKNKEVIRHA